MISTVVRVSAKPIRDRKYINNEYILSVIILTKCDIGMSSFENCRNIQTLILDVKNIGKYAFKDCKSLHTCNFDNVESISENAFENCSNLTELRLNSNLKQIGRGAFKGCMPTMILCSQEIYNKYFTNHESRVREELDMRYLFEDVIDITRYYRINKSMILFYENYDVSIINIKCFV